MGRFAFVNGTYTRHKDAVISIDDRGVQFGDAVYEVFTLCGGIPIDEKLHMDRLERSLSELDIEMPYSRQAFAIIVKNLIRKNGLKNGIVYFQVSRGTYPRDHFIPDVALKPNIIITTKDMAIPTSVEDRSPIKVISAPDNRWGRVDIKTVMLLPNCLAKTKAKKQGALEVMFVKDGVVTESASSNFYFVDKDANIVTHPQGGILMGITRHTLLECAKKLQISVIERQFSPTEAINASEAFISSATTFVTPISHIDNKAIGNGDNPIIKRLHEAYTKATLNL